MSSTYKFIDNNGNVLKELDQVGLQAFNAVGLQVAKKHTCMIAIEGDPPNPIGSGTFVEVGNQLFVATAKHLFENLQADKLIGIYWGEEDNRYGVTNSDIILDEKLDLAAIPIAPDIGACGVSLRCLQPNHPEAESDLFVLSGVPLEKCKIYPNSKPIVVGHFSHGLVSLPLESWPTNPELAISPDVDLFLNYTRDLATDGNVAPMRQIDPHGLSGGGVWSVPVLSQGSVWSPANATLVAVQSSVESDKWRYLRATRIEHWLRLAIRTRKRSVIA
jgi:hypothetical protein